MTDRDHVQLNVLRIIYSNSQILLCKWHVLHTIQSHFNTNEFLDLWAKVKAFVKTLESADFARLWVEISNDPSVLQSFVQYIRAEWIPEAKMWSMVMWKNHSILKKGNTNMLLEAYVFTSRLQ